MENIKKGMQIFWFFFRIGFFTFGGGWSIVAQIQKEFVERRKWVTEEQLLDTVSVGRSLPGLMIGNVSFMFGYQNGGVFCGLMALLGISMPALLIMIVVTACYTQIKDNVYVARAMTGIRAAVVPIIGSAGLRLRGSAFRDKLCYGIAAVMFVTCAFLDWNCAALIAASAVIGLIFGKEDEHANTV
ncbi:MAG: chromate transporter [Clostridiales bacterium]|nr:chromate transporter [Clostridiales bacterium]